MILSKAFNELRNFAELLGIPVMTTTSGRGSIPEGHPLALGLLGALRSGDRGEALPFRLRCFDILDQLYTVLQIGGCLPFFSGTPFTELIGHSQSYSVIEQV